MLPLSRGANSMVLTSKTVGVVVFLGKHTVTDKIFKRSVLFEYLMQLCRVILRLKGSWLNMRVITIQFIGILGMLNYLLNWLQKFFLRPRGRRLISIHPFKDNPILICIESIVIILQNFLRSGVVNMHFSLSLSIFLPLSLYLSFLLLSTSHYELKCSQSFSLQVNVEADECQNWYCKDQSNGKEDPSGNDGGFVGSPQIFAVQESDREAKDKHKEESCQDHKEEAGVILFSNAVIDPGAVVIKIIDASITQFTVPRATPDIASAGIAVQTVFDILTHLLTVTVPVVQHDRVSRIYLGAVETSYHQDAQVYNEHSDEGYSCAL